MQKKPEYHQSRIKNYFRCPKMFDLSIKIEPEIGTSTQNVMREGQLFEGYVLGFKDDKNEAELIGRKKPETIASLRLQAEQIAPIFKTGLAYQKLRYETPEYILAGEADHIGTLDWDYIFKYTGENIPVLGKSINDLKKTGSIKYVWNDYSKKSDYIQAIMYVYIHFKNTGELLPFVYVIVEDTYDKPIVKFRKIFIQETDFEWLENIINVIHNDLFYCATPGFESCEGGKMGSRCWWLQWCGAGRNYIGETEIVAFGDLADNKI